ncbi:MAG: hypothetical protein ABI587_10130 [Gemmatimonadales bacterium]
MARTLLFLGWFLVALNLVTAAVLLFGRPSGDAATGGVGPGLGALLVIISLIAAVLLLWAGRGEGRPIALAVACTLAAIPVALAIALTASPQWILGVVYPSMRERPRPMEASAQYAYPDAAGRDAALVLVMNDYAKLDTLLRSTPAPDLTAHDERGQSLLGLATIVALTDGGTMRDLEGLRLLLAAGARPRADDMGSEEPLIELVTRVSGDRASAVLALLLDAGLAPDTPMHDGRSVLFHPDLTPGAARLLLARGANLDAHEMHGDAGDWSPVTFHADQRHWATALALLEGGVPRDHGTPAGALLERVLRDGAVQTTDEERADSGYQAFMAAVR